MSYFSTKWDVASGNSLHNYGQWLEIVDFAIENGGSFHSSVNIYQMVCPIIAQEMAGRYWMVDLPI